MFSKKAHNMHNPADGAVDVIDQPQKKNQTKSGRATGERKMNLRALRVKMLAKT